MWKQMLDGWPLAQQIIHGGDGTGLEARSARTRALRPKHDGAEAARSVCPYCAVGCGQLIYHKNGKLISIEGDPESPVSRGRLCPKGSASFELLTHPGRLTKVRYRRPGSTAWEDLDLVKVDLVKGNGQTLVIWLVVAEGKVAEPTNHLLTRVTWQRAGHTFYNMLNFQDQACLGTLEKDFRMMSVFS